MSMYPIGLRLEGKLCCVIGGGKVAERKVEGLLATGGIICVISPQVTERLEQLAKQGRITVERRVYRYGDLEDASLVFAATDDEAVHMEICEEARERGLWVNDAMSPERSTFHVPAVLRRGDLVMTVATTGSAPLVASFFRDELAARYGDSYGRLVEILGKWRNELKEVDIPPDEKRQIIRRWLEHYDQIIDTIEKDGSEDHLNLLKTKLMYETDQ